MSKLYNTSYDIVNSLNDFFHSIDFKLSKPQTKIIPSIVSAIVQAENVTTSDISKVFTDFSLSINSDSIQKKLWRFFNNSHFDGISFYNHFGLVLRNIHFLVLSFWLHSLHYNLFGLSHIIIG